jgi:iron complex outermembrane receptor protein
MHIGLAVWLLILALLSNPTSAESAAGEEFVVTATKDAAPSLGLSGNTAKIPAEQILITNHQHIYELGVRAAGTWISRGSGQEHLTAIRSPVLTGPGACGAFLILEDGIPTRPAGFCNVNQLFEIPTEQAVAVEIIRGPSNALYGSNGLHGTMNFLLPTPGASPGWNASGEVGPDSFYRGKLGWDGEPGNNKIAAGLLADHYDGFRDDSGYQQQKGFFRLNRTVASGDIGLNFSASNLDQETAGFIIGQDAYKDPAVRTTNPNPEAFRDADSQRLSASWAPDAEHALSGSEFIAYLRHSDMEFLQHFLPGQPLEQNGQVSGGLMWDAQYSIGNTSSLTTGVDMEVANGFLKQYQATALPPPPAFFATLPQGFHYNYEVDSFMVAPYGQLYLPFADAWEFVAGLRLEYLRYDYDNKMATGNTQDDGVTPCGGGGCRYNRPGDRTDSFLNLAPNIGLLYHVNAETSVFANLQRGFRAPQTTELYRLQANQSVADLDSETIDSFELGLRRQTSWYRIETAVFAMEKKNFIFQDANRFNISDGETRHWGVELQAEVNAENGLYAGFAGTFARHTYEFDRAARGETIVSGNDVDTAPRSLGSARVGVDRPIGLLEAEWVHQGDYFLDAANAHRYDGHNLLNIRSIWRFQADWSVGLRLNNLTDKLYADRADFAFGNYRYFPGRTREVFLQIAYRTL